MSHILQKERDMKYPARRTKKRSYFFSERRKKLAGAINFHKKSGEPSRIIFPQRSTAPALRNDFGRAGKAQLVNRHPGLGVRIQRVQAGGPVILQSTQIIEQSDPAMLVGKLRDR